MVAIAEPIPRSQAVRERRAAAWAACLEEDPVLLGALALAPAWSFDVLQALFRTNPQSQKPIGWLLDQWCGHGLIEACAAPEMQSWEFDLRPEPEARSRLASLFSGGLAESSFLSGTTLRVGQQHRSESELRAQLDAASQLAASLGVSDPGRFFNLLRYADRSGLLDDRSGGEAASSVSSSDTGGDAPPFAAESCRVLAADAELRTGGLRFWSRQPFRLGEPWRVEVRRPVSASESTAPAPSLGMIVACRGDAWSGFKVTLVFLPASGQTWASWFLLDAALYSSVAVPKARRAELLPSLKGQFGSLDKFAADLARQVQGQAGTLPLSKPLSRWAAAAIHLAEGPHSLVRWLTHAVDGMLASDDPGEAHALLSAVQFLNEVLEGTLAIPVGLAERRLELAYRRSVDARMLRSFLSRKDQLRVFRSLLKRDSPAWALHYLGVGGVGKTMLLRYFTARRLPRLKLPFSRVDFDFLTPDYPVRRPGQLLLELAEGLRAYAKDPGTDERFQYFCDEAMSLHHRLASAPPSNDPLMHLRTTEFEMLLQKFCEFVHSLPADPVVLILDTCEELARMQPGGAFQPAVEATFEILERVHDALAQRGRQVRVVLAGRRLLALAGHDWEAPEYHDAERRAHYASVDPRKAGQAVDPRRPYLRLHVVRGFNAAEAHRFLSRKKAPAPATGRLPMPDPLQEAVLTRSVEGSDGVKVLWSPPCPEDAAPRYNPFDLALFADWYLENDSLTPEMIASGKSDAYVEMRVLRRLRHADVHRAVPVLVLLRRCEKELLRRALDLEAEEFANLYRELCQLEWVEYQPSESGPAFLEVDRNLWPRLERYFHAGAQAAALNEAKEALRPELRQYFQQTKLRDWVIEYLDAALRILPPEESAALWARVEEQICQEGDWNWVRQHFERLLAAEESHPPALRAHLWATRNAVLLHTQPDLDLVADWRKVEQFANDHPDPILRQWLHERAALGTVAALARMNEPVPREALDRFFSVARATTRGADAEPEGFRFDQKLAALGAAMESVVEQIERGVTYPAGTAESLRAEMKRLKVPEDQLQLMVPLLIFDCRLRQVVAEGQAGATRPVLPGSLPTPARNRRQWLDWRQAANWQDWVRLQTLPFLPEADQRACLAPNSSLVAEAAQRLTDVNADRLLSALWQARLRSGVILREEITRLVALPGLLDPKIPVCNAHRRTPALFITLAQAWLALGEASQAINLINQGLNRQGLDADSVRLAEETKLQVVRRMRLPERGEALLKRMAPGDRPEDARTAWPVLRLLGPFGAAMPAPPVLTKAAETGSRSSAERVLRWWHVQELLSEGGRDAARAMPTSAFEAAARGLPKKDPLRRWLGAARAERMILGVGKGIAGVVEEIGSELQQPVADEGEITWQMPLFTHAFFGRNLNDQELLRHVGPRQLANWALDEGELLALRFPEFGTRLLDQAFRFFRQSQDDAGAFIAAVRGVVARLHARQPDEARLWLDQAAWPAYEALQPQAGLPPRSALEAEGAAAPTAPPDWGPWLNRLRGCVLALRGEAAPDVPASAGSTAPVALPVEMDFEPGRRKPRERGRIFTLLNQSFGCLMVIGIVIVFLVLGREGFNRGMAWVGQPDLARPWQYVGGLVLMVFAGWLLVRLHKGVERLRSWLASRGQARLRLEIAGAMTKAGVSAEQPMTAQFTFEHRRWFRTAFGWLLLPFRGFQRVYSQITGEWTASVTDPPHTTNAPAHLLLELRQWAKWLKGRTLPIAVECDWQATSYPWEAALLMDFAPVPEAAMPAKLKRAGWTYQLYRRLPVPPDDGPSERLRIDKVCVLSGRRWHDGLLQAWKPVSSDAVIATDEPSAVAEEGRLVHIVGRPLLTHGGVRLKIETQAEFAQRFVRNLEAAPATERLIGPDSIGARGRFLVLQAEPAPVSNLTPSDREQLARLRTLAGEMFLAGAAGVLMLPTLDPELSAQVVQRLGTALWGSSPDHRRWLDLTDEIRTLILEWRPPPTQNAEPPSESASATTSPASSAGMQLELALNVTLFARAQLRHLRESPPPGMASARAK